MTIREIGSTGNAMSVAFADGDNNSAVQNKGQRNGRKIFSSNFGMKVKNFFGISVQARQSGATDSRAALKNGGAMSLVTAVKTLRPELNALAQYQIRTDMIKNASAALRQDLAQDRKALLKAEKTGFKKVALENTMAKKAAEPEKASFSLKSLFGIHQKPVSPAPPLPTSSPPTSLTPSLAEIAVLPDESDTLVSVLPIYRAPEWAVNAVKLKMVGSATPEKIKTAMRKAVAPKKPAFSLENLFGIRQKQALQSPALPAMNAIFDIRNVYQATAKTEQVAETQKLEATRNAIAARIGGKG
jgi:hypothetical protein